MLGGRRQEDPGCCQGMSCFTKICIFLSKNCNGAVGGDGPKATSDSTDIGRSSVSSIPGTTPLVERNLVRTSTQVVHRPAKPFQSQRAEPPGPQDADEYTLSRVSVDSASETNELSHESANDEMSDEQRSIVDSDKTMYKPAEGGMKKSGSRSVLSPRCRPCRRGRSNRGMLMPGGVWGGWLFAGCRCSLRRSSRPTRTLSACSRTTSGCERRGRSGV